MTTFTQKDSGTVQVRIEGRLVGSILAERFGWWQWQPQVIAPDCFDGFLYSADYLKTRSRRFGTLEEIKAQLL